MVTVTSSPSTSIVPITSYVEESVDTALAGVVTVSPVGATISSVLVIVGTSTGSHVFPFSSSAITTKLLSPTDSGTVKLHPV